MSPTGHIIGRLVLLALIVLAFGYFFWRVGQLYRLMRRGAPEDRGGDVGRRLRRVAAMVLANNKLFEKPGIGLAHFLIFWGFLIITLGTFERLIAGLFGRLRLPPLGTTRAFITVNDVLAALVIASLLYAAYRRLRVRPWYLTTLPDALVIIAMIGGHLSAYLLSEAFAAAAFGAEGEHWSPAGVLLGGPLAALGAGAAEAGFVVFWWLDVLLILGLLMYMPHSKHFHVVTSPFSVYFKSTRPQGELRKIENIEEAEHFGASQVTQFTWKDLLDAYTCTECGRCTNACPANLSGKPLDPKKIIVDIRLALYAQGDLPMLARGQNRKEVTAETPLIGGLIHDDELWSCTTCMACVEACPVAIEHVPKIVDMRRALVLEESRFPPELTPAFNSLERHNNPFGFPANKRADWAKGLEIATFGEVEEPPDVLYWVGCYGSFDERNQKVARALATVLKSAGVSFGILGVEESCTGDPARRAGNEYLYQVLAEANVELLKGYGVKKIVTACPHCMNTLKNEYPQFGGDFEVVHHSQFIAGLLKSGQLQLADGVDRRAITFHDPCYLGRYNDVYDQPREVLAGLGGEYREMRRARNKSLCCGGGGARTFMEERIGKKMSHNRLGDVLETGAETLAAGCPFCITMFEDGIRTSDNEERVRVQDLAELVAARLPSGEQPNTESGVRNAE